MPGPRGKQPDCLPGAVGNPVHEFNRFSDAGAAQHIHNHRNHGISWYPETFSDTEIEPVFGLLGSIGRCPEWKGLVEFGVEAFHGDAEQFTRHHNPAS